MAKHRYPTSHPEKRKRSIRPKAPNPTVWKGDSLPPMQQPYDRPSGCSGVAGVWHLPWLWCRWVCAAMACAKSVGGYLSTVAARWRYGTNLYSSAGPQVLFFLFSPTLFKETFTCPRGEFELVKCHPLKSFLFCCLRKRNLVVTVRGAGRALRTHNGPAIKGSCVTRRKHRAESWYLSREVVTVQGGYGAFIVRVGCSWHFFLWSN